MTFTPPGEGPPPDEPPPAPPVPGWWLASDGNWYPPEATPGAPPPPYGVPPAYGPPPSFGPPTGYGPPPGQGPPMPSPYGYTPYAQPRGTNGFAIASLVLGIIWLYWIGSILAIIFGFVALSQIKERQQSGRGMAIAGLLLGFFGLAMIVLVVLIVSLGSNASTKFTIIGSSIN